MTEGELLKLYVKRENINEEELANKIDVPEGDLSNLYQSQTIEAGIKEKLQSFLNRDIFDGTLLTDYYTNVPDEQANKMKN